MPASLRSKRPLSETETDSGQQSKRVNSSTAAPIAAIQNEEGEQSPSDEGEAMRRRPVRFEDLLDSEKVVQSEFEKVHAAMRYARVMQKIRESDVQDRLSTIEDLLKQLLARRQKKQAGGAAPATRQPSREVASSDRCRAPVWQEHCGHCGAPSDSDISAKALRIREEQGRLMRLFDKISFESSHCSYYNYNNHLAILVKLADPLYLPSAN